MAFATIFASSSYVSTSPSWRTTSYVNNPDSKRAVEMRGKNSYTAPSKKTAHTMAWIHTVTDMMAVFSSSPPLGLLLLEHRRVLLASEACAFERRGNSPASLLRRRGVDWASDAARVAVTSTAFGRPTRTRSPLTEWRP